MPSGPSAPAARPARPPVRRGRLARSAALAALTALTSFLAGCSDQAEDQFGEAVTGQGKIDAAVGAAIQSELAAVGQEVASWYTAGLGGGDPKVVTSGGVHYICAATAPDCAAEGAVISPASEGAQIALARTGQDAWCAQASSSAGQAHITSALTPEEGPC
ncbi:MAG: hypothetical protein LBG60_15460 [Bifidobacteriaceae bacterium]|jgi:hypothetical protein|nr:hypothetical protein [Bifidobacteriaceae bacterium]